MEKHFQNLAIATSQLDRRQIQLLILVGTLILFVLGAGAPESGGGSCGTC